MIRTKEIGRLLSDEGDVVVFSLDELSRFADAYNVEVDELIEVHKGVRCGFDSEGTFGVDRVTAVTKEGKTVPAVLIGLDPDNVCRFLKENEPTWDQFFKNHPKSGDKASFNEIVADYGRLLVD